MPKKSVSDELISKLHIESLPTDQLEQSVNFLYKLLDYRALTKLHTTYVKGVKKALDYNQENKIYCDFKLEGTVTGRLSCGGYKAGKGKPKGVSFHTLPREKKRGNIRNLFVAPEDWDFVAADFKTMEMRVLAHITESRNLINAFRSGIDFHKYSASLVYEKESSEVTPLERQIAKSVSFLVVYGGGEYRLSKTANVSIEVARHTLQAYESSFPEIFDWMEEERKFIRENKYSESIFGRRRHLENIRSPIPRVRLHAERQGINFKVQSPASDILCFCLLDIANEFEKRGMDAYVTASVHDSIEVLSPKDETIEVCQIMREKMTNYPLLKSTMGFNCVVPLEIDIEVGPSFGVAGEVVFSDQGKVIRIEDPS